MIATHERYDVGRYLLVTGGSLIEVEARFVGSVGDRSVVAAGAFLREKTSILLNHTAIFTREGATALGVCALTGNQDRIFRSAEVVVFGEHTGT